MENSFEDQFDNKIFEQSGYDYQVNKIDELSISEDFCFMNDVLFRENFVLTGELDKVINHTLTNNEFSSTKEGTVGHLNPAPQKLFNDEADFTPEV